MRTTASAADSHHTDAQDEPRRVPHVSITITQELMYTPPAHLVGKETTKRLGHVFFETTDARGKHHTKRTERVSSGTPMQAEISAAAEALNSLKVPCVVRVITESRALAERPESASNLNPDCWRILARAEAHHQVTYELRSSAKSRAGRPDFP